MDADVLVKEVITMGIIKGIGKVLGTTVLGATGVASTVLKEMFDTVRMDDMHLQRLFRIRGLQLETLLHI